MPCIPWDQREVIYLIVHNKLSVIERLFHIGLSADPYCISWLKNKKRATVADLEHLFCGFQLVAHVWYSLKDIPRNLIPVNLQDISDFDLLHWGFLKLVKRMKFLGYWLFIWMKYGIINRRRALQGFGKMKCLAFKI